MSRSTHSPLVALIVTTLLAGCATSGPASEPPTWPTPKVVTNVNETFELTITEANAATIRSGHGESCVSIQSQSGIPVRVMGQAVATWSVNSPNPGSLRLGWYDADHLASMPSVSGTSPLSVTFDGTAGEVGHEVTVFVGTADDSALVVDQHVSVSVNLTAEGGTVRLYAFSCTVSG